MAQSQHTSDDTRAFFGGHPFSFFLSRSLTPTSKQHEMSQDLTPLEGIYPIDAPNLHPSRVVARLGSGFSVRQ